MCMRRRVVALFFLSFLASVLQILYLPALSVYMARLGYGAAVVGVVGGASSLVYAVGAASSGLVRGRMGDWDVVKVSLVLMGVVYGLLPFIRGEELLLVVASVGMLSYSFFWPAVEGGVRREEGSVHRFSFSWSAGTLVGSAAAFLVVEVDPRVVFGAFFVAALAMAFAASFFGGEGVGEALSLHGVRRLADAWLGAFAYAASLGGVLVFYPLYVLRAGLSPVMVSVLLFSVVGARTLFFRVLGRVKVPLVLAPVLLAAGAAAPCFEWWAAVFFVGFLMGWGEALLYVYALDRVFSEGGEYTGFFEAAIGLGYAAGPFIGGLFPKSLRVAVAAPVALAVAASIVSLVLGRWGELEDGVFP